MRKIHITIFKRKLSKLSVLFCLIVSLSYPLSSLAQRFEGGIFFGGSNHAGDVGNGIFVPSETRLSIGGILRYNLTTAFSIKGNFYKGYLSGSDANSPDEALQKRGFATKGAIQEIGINLEWNFLRQSGYDKGGGVFKMVVNPYVFVGVAATNCTAKPTAPATMTPYPFPEEGAVNNFVAVPMGIGIKWHIIENFSLGFEVGQRTVFSDYLDGISKAANPNKGDWYLFGGLSLTYIIGNDPFTLRNH
jgi:hypothetical protein